MPSIADLRMEIEKEKGFLKIREKEEKNEDLKRNLSKELKQLRFKRKYGRSVDNIKKDFKPVVEGGKKAWKGLAGAFGELQKNSAMQEKETKKQPPRRGLFG